MTGFNHAAVGGFAGKLLPLPFAIPVAFASHFVLDMLPHYGISHDKRDNHFWRIFTVLDFLLTTAYLVWVLFVQQHYAVFFCGIIAVCPDFIWVARIIRTRSFDLSEPKSRFAKWHARIQRYERPWGIYLEIPLGIILGVLAYRFW